MQIKSLLPMALFALVVGSGLGAFAQQSDAGSQAAAPSKQTSDDDLSDLAAELEARAKQDETDAAQKAAADEKAMQAYETRAQRQAAEARKRLLANEQWRPTHKQVKRIEVPSPLNNMCLDSKGRILACCGDKKIRVLSQDGELLETRSLTFVPEAIGVRSSDGAIFVGGQGQLVRLSAEGELQEKRAFPPAPSEADQEATVKALLKQAEEQIKQMESTSKGLKKQLAAVNKQLAETPIADEQKKQIEAMSEEDLFGCVEGSTNSGEQTELCFIKGTSLGVQARSLELYIKQFGDIDMKQLEQQARQQAAMQTGTGSFTGMAVADDDLFVICSGAGYTFNAWRMNHDLLQPEQVLTGLRGCCGQMDCQTHDGNLWVAMNSQHKVLCYDRDGKELSGFGKTDAQAADGFGGCCEPKNLRFSKDGQYVYCASSGPPVCVKRFTLDGQFKDVVCFPVYQTGCVRVSVDVAGDTFFMMSPNESAIYVFQPQES